jgi:glycosyltransferase involved in cell wall biosynthesis
MKRVAIIHNEFHLTGSPLAAYYAARYLKNNGYSVSCISPEEGELEVMYQNLGIHTMVIPNIRWERKLAEDISWNYDVAIVFNLDGYEPVYGFKDAGKPVIFSCHESQTATVAEFQHSDISVCCCAWQIDYFSKLSGVPKERFRLIYLSTELPGEDGPPPFERNSPEEMHVLQLGTIEERKGQIIAVQAFKETHPNIHLHIVGQKREPAEFLEEPIPNITVHPAVPRTEVKRWLLHSDLIIIPSIRQEALPTVILESQLCSKPVIASDIAGTKEALRHEYDGFIIAPSDFKDLADKINFLYRNPEIRKRMGQYGHQYFKANKCLERYGRQYAEIVDQLTP